MVPSSTKLYIVFLPPREIMNLSVLKDLGFTQGEIKVYSALLSLQKSTVTKIIEKSGVSSSKVYLILDKLIHKGLVRYIIIKNAKEFHLSPPSELVEYVEREKAKLVQAERKTRKLVEQISSSLSTYSQESAQIYRGTKGVKAAHVSLLEGLTKDDVFRFFSVEKTAVKNKATRLMFADIHAKREARKIPVRGIALPELKGLFHKYFPNTSTYNVRFHPLTLNQGITIGKDRIIIENALPEPFAVEIISEQMAKRYQEFFDKLWRKQKNNSFSQLL